MTDPYEEKSHVGMETNLCVVCGKEFETGTIFLDRRLKNTLKTHNCTDWGICPEHQQQIDEGYCHLVVGVPPDDNTHVQPADVNRTGEIISVKEHVLRQVITVPPNKVMFIDPEAAEQLKQIFGADS